MAALSPQPLTDYTAQLEIVRKIDRLGGSAGYDSNSDAFSEFVPALDPFKPDVWTRSTKELTKHEHDRAAQALKAKLQAELDLHRSNPKLARKRRVYEIIKGIESLGGTAGLENFARESQGSNLKSTATDAKESSVAAAAGWPFIYAWGFAVGGLVVTAVTIHTGDHQGSGHAWGPAFGAGNLQGTLAYGCYCANGFHFQNLSGVATAEITLNGKLTSQFAGAVIGNNTSLAFGGKWHWSPSLVNG